MHHLIAAQAEVEQRLCKRREAVKPIGLASVFALCRPPLILPQRFFAFQQRSNGDRHMYAARTRFIPDSILHYFGSCAWPVAVPANTSGKAKGDPVNIGVQLRRMWS
jgi:hypothetical protein